MYYDNARPKNGEQRFVYEDVTDGDPHGNRLEKALKTYINAGGIEYLHMAYGEGDKYIWSGDFELSRHEVKGEKWFAAGFYSYHGFFFTDEWKNVELFVNKFAIPFCNRLNAEAGEGDDTEAPAFKLSGPSDDSDLLTGKVSSISNINVFGPKVVSRYGKNRLVRLPAHRTIELGNGGLLVMIGNELVMHDSTMIMGTPREMKEVLEEYAAFFKLPKPQKMHVV